MEFKGKMANHLNDHFQLCAAALCLEERGAAYLWEIFYHTIGDKGDLYTPTT